jgi:hypothetical protein
MLGAANTVTSKLPQLTVLVHVASLTQCHGLRSCHLTILNANGLIMFNLDYAFSPFANQMQVGLKCNICYKAISHLHLITVEPGSCLP